MDAFSQLPLLVKEKIFGYLHVPAKQAAAQVCHEWKNVIYYPAIWRPYGKSICARVVKRWPDWELCRSLFERGIRSIQCNYMDFDGPATEYFIGCLPELESLTLFCCKNTSDQNMSRLFSTKQLPKLDELCLLCLPDSDINIDVMVAMLARNCKNLKTLCLITPNTLTEEGLLHMATGLRKLESLFLYDTSAITCRGLGCLAGSEQGVGVKASLKSLTLCAANLTDGILSNISKMEDLKKLKLVRCTNDPQLEFNMIANGNSKIVEIYLENYFPCPTTGLMTTLSKMQFLRKLTLKTTTVLAKELTLLADGASKICELHISLSSCLSNEGLVHIARLEHLRKLTLGPIYAVHECDVTDAGLAVLSSGLAPIEELYLHSISCISNQGLMFLSRLVYLRVLSLRNLHWITYAGLVQLTSFESCHIFHLRVSGCLRLKEDHIVEIEKHPKLKRCLNFRSSVDALETKRYIDHLDEMPVANMDRNWPTTTEFQSDYRFSSSTSFGNTKKDNIFWKEM